MRYHIFVLMVLIGFESSACAKGEASPCKTASESSAAEEYLQRKLFIPQNNIVEMCFRYNFFVAGETSKIKAVIALPRTIPDKQKIQRIDCFPEPSREFSSKSGNQYAEFIFTEPERWVDVEIHVKVELLRYDLSTAQKKYGRRFFPWYDSADFLQAEKSIECDDPLIRKIARGIKGQDEIDTLKSIHDYVIDNMEYNIHNERMGAVYAAQRKEGDCSEYSDLFVAVCRAKRIPARVITGYAVVVDDDLPRHAWAEVYLKKYGWVPFDPTWADIKNPILREELFGTMRPLYIYVKYPDKDEVINDRRDIASWQWGDKVEMNQSVEFKQWKWQKPASEENAVIKNTTVTKPEATFGMIGGIMYTEDNPLAVIDGEILKEGDTIYGVKIIKIYEAEIEFEKDSQKWTQKVGETADTFWQ